MQSESQPEITNVERDPNLFVWFLTLVVAGMYVLTLFNTPSVRQPLVLIAFTTLTLAHLFLHWNMGKIISQPGKITWYVLGQGLLAFAILLFARNLAMTYALFMGLLGEGVGLFGLTRKSLLAALYYLALMMVSLFYVSGWEISGMLLSTTIPIVLFVILFVTLYMRQTTAREQAQALAAKLEDANRKLSDYADQVEELTLAAERQRMARELHDTLSQGLSGLVLQLEAAKAHLEAGRDERAASIIDQSMSRARSALADSRSVIDDLRHMPASLPEAMHRRAERFTQVTGIPCDLNLDLDDTLLPPSTSDHFLRVLDEALANAIRHAQAAHVWVSLSAVNDHCTLEIRDDGQGFDPANMNAAGHYGLLGMRERARLLDGSLQVESAPGQGARILLSVPFPQES